MTDRRGGELHERFDRLQQTNWNWSNGYALIFFPHLNDSSEGLDVK